MVDDHLEMAKSVADGLATEPFDALVTDLRMPTVDGLELLSVSRKLDPERKGNSG